MRRYGGDPGILGRSVTLSGVPTEIVGVMPASYAFPDPSVDVWMADQVTRAANGVPTVITFHGSDLLGENVSGTLRKMIARYGVWCSWRAAQRASGTDWFAPFLMRLMAEERYPIVRYLAHRGLKSAHGDVAGGYDYLALPADRSAGIRRRVDGH